MAKILIQIDGLGKGESHLMGGSDFETLCGFFASGAKYEDAEGLPTCFGCISQAKACFSSITKKEIKNL